jgi:FKBP-type peptidyl-prolyl cis-trans isomerase FkpA
MIRRSLLLALLCAANAMAQQPVTVQPAADLAAAAAAGAQSAQPAQAAAPVVQPSVPAVAEPVLDPLVIKDTKIGKGKEAGLGNKVFVNYTGWLYKPMARNQRGRQFDTSVGRGPLDFQLGAGRVIKGWEQGIGGMKVGGKRTLIIPSHLAYGKRGAGNGMIPPDADLIFDVELLQVK